MPQSNQRFQLTSETDLTRLRIVGKRLRLQSINQEFAESIFTEFTEEITTFMLPKSADTIDETLAFIDSALDGMSAGNDITFVIVKEEGEEFLGCCGIHGKSSISTPEFDIWIKKSAHGKRYGREAVALACRWAFENLGIEALLYPVDRSNYASRSIPKALSGQIVGEMRVPTARGTELDEVIYRLSKETTIPKLPQSIE